MQRIKIWEKNQEYFKSYHPEPSIKVTYQDEFIYPKNGAESPPTVEVIKSDTLTAARKYGKCTVLNFADDVNPGGAVECAGGMQEESLFRSSSLHRHLPRSLYPILQEEAILSNNVVVSFGSEEEGYRYLGKNEFLSDVISCPAVKFPKLNDKFEMYGEELEVQTKKMELVFQTAILAGNKTLILGAWGSGTYGCFQKQILKLFHEMIEKLNLTFFDRIVFAVLGKSYNVFRDEFFMD